MAHLIDESNGRANMAYVGEKPWHGLGAQLTEGADIDTWTKEAGLAFSVKKAQVRYEVPLPRVTHALESGNVLGYSFPGRHVLYRDDTCAPLGVVSDRYNIVQPADIMDFFRTVTESAGMHLETAGSLKGGQKIWALAQAGKGDNIRKGDGVKPYLLLATSFDGSLATVAKFTAVRVVCNNTITVALQDGLESGRSVRVAHFSEFNPVIVREKLGIMLSAWGAWLEAAKEMAETAIDGERADAYLVKVLSGSKIEGEAADTFVEDIRDSRAYRKIMNLFDGAAIGAELAGKGNKWALLNAVTEYIDHQRVTNADKRMNVAWFGAGDAMKSKAFEILSA